jgi:hypothetical protein
VTLAGHERPKCWFRNNEAFTLGSGSVGTLAVRADVVPGKFDVVHTAPSNRDRFKR